MAKKSHHLMGNAAGAGAVFLLRGRLKSRFLRHTAQHQSAHRNMHPSCAALRQFLIVFAQTPLPTQPAQCVRHHPTPRQHRKTTRPALRGAISRRQPNHSRLHFDNAPRYAPSAQISRSRDILPASSDNTSQAPSRSGTSAGCTTTASSSPAVSTTIWRLRLSAFLPAS